MSHRINEYCLLALPLYLLRCLNHIILHDKLYSWWTHGGNIELISLVFPVRVEFDRHVNVRLHKLLQSICIGSKERNWLFNSHHIKVTYPAFSFQ